MIRAGSRVPLRVLVTGASGFLGTELCRYLRSRDYDVTGTWYSHPPGNGDPRDQRIDLESRTEVAHLLERLAPDAILHTAAFPNADECERVPDKAYAVNDRGTAHLVAGHRTRIIYTSTDLVFDGSHGPYDESWIPAPPNVYARSKLAGETHVLRAGGVVARVALIIGRSRGSKKSFLDWFEAKLARDENVPLFIDQYRTPIYVQALCRIFEMILQRPDLSGVFHIGGEDRVNRLEIAKKYFRYFPGKEHLLVPVRMSDVAGAVRGADCSLISEKIKAELGVSTGTLDEAFADLAARAVGHGDWGRGTWD